MKPLATMFAALLVAAFFLYTGSVAGSLIFCAIALLLWVWSVARMTKEGGE